MNQNFTCTLSKVFLLLVLFSLVSSSVLPYYFTEKMGIEHLCDSKKDKDSEEKEEKKEEQHEKKEKIRDDVNSIEYSFSQKEIKYYNFKNFHYTHFQKVETPPPEFVI